MDVAGRSVRAVLEEAFAANPRLETYVLDDQRALRKHMRILVDGLAIKDLQKQSDVVGPGGVVWVMQALSGG